MNILKNITFLLLGVTLFSSCTIDDVEDRPVKAAITVDVAPTLLTPITNTVDVKMGQSTAKNEALNISWLESDYVKEGVVKYQAYIAKTGAGFDSGAFKLGAETTTTQVGVSEKDLNDLLITSFGLAIGDEGTFDIRLESVLGETKLYSKVVTFKAKTFKYVEEVVVNAPFLYVPGGYQAASGYGSDWAPATAPMLTLKAGQDKPIYEGYVYMMGASKFKIVNQPNWDGKNYGVGSVKGTLDLTGADIELDGKGLYFVTVNLEKLEYSFVLQTWGIIGSATPGGWNADTDMTWDASIKSLSIKLDLIVGEYKFRADDAWGVNYGGALGALTKDGANLPVATAGNYTVTFDVSAKTATITKN